MSESKTGGLGGPAVAFVLAAVITAAAIWATVAMASSGPSSPRTSSTPGANAVYGGPMYAASGGTKGQGSCPNMGDSGSGSGTAPSTTTPSTTSPNASL